MVADYCDSGAGTWATAGGVRGPVLISWSDIDVAWDVV